MSERYLFVNENIFTFNSGTEFSAMNRQKLFRKHGIDSKIVTRNYNQGLHQEIAKYGLKDDDIINMYDYFQGTMHVPHHHEKLRYSKIVDKRYDKIIGVNSNYSLLKRGQRTVAKVNIFPLTVGEVGIVSYYDDFGNVTSRDIWDGRGFKSKTQYMHPDGTIGDEIVYNYQGVPVIEITHMYINHKTKQVGPTMFKLLNYKGHNWRFNTEDDMFDFFLDDLLKQKPAVVINDRPTLTGVVAKLKYADSKYQLLHNEQTTNAAMAGSAKGKLFPVLEPLFHKYLQDYDGLIVPTVQQKQDLNRLFPEVPVYAISDTALDSDHMAKVAKELKPAAKKDNNLLYIGRIAHDKHIDQLIQIASFVKNSVPDLTLEVVGYFESPQYQKMLQQQVKRLGMQKSVKFINYAIGDRKDKLMKDAKAMAQTSFGEGLSMSLVNGLEYGLPEVAYNVNYGPNNIIENGKNGYLVPQGNIREAANHLAKIMSDNSLNDKLSKGALAKAKEFNDDAIINQWKPFFKNN
ncbi:glycosyltransferase [Acetilactobacillus jinshanensis]|uniref:Glycosyltransferase n=1 Tax=Acetilactobacillus jinshanensis TaxID=1720083 RepID=A0A4P6ZJI1_9LACO|nr:glycosyltransferase [Acetilactobacillus jinshanensis]QBP17788.1 glycosyltransferase [Acetilactobacillus jinshanensis]URL60651.1 glycosyltransferase [uncultured bacterium]